MRVLFLTQTFPRTEHDSAGPFIRDLARGLVRNGLQVTVLVPRSEGVQGSWSDQGVEIQSFAYAPRDWEVIGYSRTLRADEGVRWKAALAAPLYLLGARRALNRALRSGLQRILHAHWIVPNGLAAIVPSVLPAPLLIGLHGSDVFLAERAGVRSLVRRVLGHASAVTSCSPEFVARLERLAGRELPASVIPYGVDGALFSPDRSRGLRWRERLRIPPDAVVALAVGRMVTKKGFHLLIEVAPRLLSEIEGLHLVLAGAGDLLDQFRARAAAWPGRIHLPGPVLHDELPDLYRAADLFVLPAVHDPRGNVDGLPNVVLEAMASGLPVVSSRISGIPLAVLDGETGVLVEEGDLEALAEALLSLVRSPELRREWGARARRRAEEDLSWDRVARDYRAVYEAVLKEPGAPLRAAGPRGGSRA